MNAANTGAKTVSEISKEWCLNMARKEEIDEMVSRFLTWRLPEDFNPDGGITFTPTYIVFGGEQRKHEPTRTNLFTYTQARAMVEHMIAARKDSEDV